MPATRLGFDSVLSRQTSFLRRIRENLQSVWTPPGVALPVPHSAAGLPIHLLDESRAVRNARAQFGSIGAHAIVCLRCPDPLYSDEARKAKMQGQVTMRVLVGLDGRAGDIQLTLGLDENAVRVVVRGWQFVPAKDAARRPVATWITIETVFRLF